MKKEFHKPVLAKEVLALLELKSGSRVVDCTFGGGGHSSMILDMIGPDGKLLAIDRDEEAIRQAKDLAVKHEKRLTIVKGEFADLKKIVSGSKFTNISAILFDLGVSDWQLDSSVRGISYKFDDANLDMRMGDSTITAAEILNTWDRADLYRIFSDYSELRGANKLVKEVISSRRASPLRKCKDLKRIIDSIGLIERKGVNIYAKVWQGLRMAVNDEYGQLVEALNDSVDLLVKGGRLAVISFHSGEDRIVKKLFADFAKGCVCPKDFPKCICGKDPILRIITKKPIAASELEISINNKSRSAKLRVAEKI